MREEERENKDIAPTSKPFGRKAEAQSSGNSSWLLMLSIERDFINFGIF
jgi:hypothetical protein